MIATLSRCDRAADPPAAYMPTAGRAQPSGVASECQSRDDVIRAPATRAGRPGHFIGSAQPKYLTISPLLGLSAPPSGASPGPAKLTVDGATPCRAPQGSGRSTQVRPESLRGASSSRRRRLRIGPRPMGRRRLRRHRCLTNNLLFPERTRRAAGTRCNASGRPADTPLA